MKLLMDTHAFIWWDSDPQKLSREAMAACQDSEDVVLFSVASVWEMQIKTHLGKLKLNLPLPELIDSQRRINKVEILPVAKTVID